MEPDHEAERIANAEVYLLYALDKLTHAVQELDRPGVAIHERLGAALRRLPPLDGREFPVTLRGPFLAILAATERVALMSDAEALAVEQQVRALRAEVDRRTD
jgi:hypothetical protein